MIFLISSACYLRRLITRKSSAIKQDDFYVSSLFSYYVVPCNTEFMLIFIVGVIDQTKIQHNGNVFFIIGGIQSFVDVIAFPCLILINRSFPFKRLKFEKKKKKNQKKRRSGSFHIRFDYFIFIIPWFALNQSYLTTIFTCVHQKTCSCMFSSRYKTLCVIGQPLCVTFLTNHHEKQVKDSFILYQSCSHD